MTSSSSSPIPAPECKIELNQIQIKNNNLLGCFDYPDNKPLYEPMVRFLTHCPIHKAFTNQTSSYMYINYLQEFWYTAKFNKSSHTIHFTLGNGTKHLGFSVDYFTRVTGFQYLNAGESYTINPSTNVAKAIFPPLGYSDNSPKNRPLAELLQKPISKAYMSPTWRILAGNIIQSLGPNTGSFDQFNTTQLMIAYGLITGSKLHFGRLVFDDLAHKLTAKTRGTYVPYMRFLSLVFQELLGEEYDQVNQACIGFKQISRKIYDLEPHADEVSLTVPMLKVCPNTFIRGKPSTTKMVVADTGSRRSRKRKATEGTSSQHEAQLGSQGTTSLKDPSATTQVPKPKRVKVTKTPSTLAGPLQKETSEKSKGKYKRLRKMTLTPEVNIDYPASPSATSKQVADESQGTQQATSTPSSLSGAGEEEGPTQPISESSPTPTQPTEILHAESARSDEVAGNITPATEEPTSAPDESLAQQQAGEEGPHHTFDTLPATPLMEDIDLLLADEEEPYQISEDDAHILHETHSPSSPEPLAFAPPLHKSPNLSTPNSPNTSTHKSKSPIHSSNLGALTETIHQLSTKVDRLADENVTLTKRMTIMRKAVTKAARRSKKVHQTLHFVGQNYENNLRPILEEATSDLASIQADQTIIVENLAGHAEHLTQTVRDEIANQFADKQTEESSRLTSLESKVDQLESTIQENSSEVALVNIMLSEVMEVQQQQNIMLENIHQAIVALSKSGDQQIRTGSEPVPMGEKNVEPQTSQATDILVSSPEVNVHTEPDSELRKLHEQIQGEQPTQGEIDQFLVITRSSESRRRKHIIQESEDEEDEEVVVVIDSELEEARSMNMTVEQLRDLKQKQIRDFELLHQRQQEERASLAEIERSKAEEARILKKTKDIAEDPQALQEKALKEIESKKAEELAGKQQKLKKLWDDYQQMRVHRVRPEPIHKIKCEVNSKKLLDMVVYRGGKDTDFDMLKDVKLGMFGFSELEEIHNLVMKMKGRMGTEMMKRLNQKFKKVIEVEKILGINPDLPLSTQTPRILATLDSSGPGCSVIPSDLPLELGQHPHNLECPVGIPFAEGKVIRSPEFGMFFTNVAQQSCFQRGDELNKCSTIQLISLKSVCKKNSRDEEFMDLIDAILQTRDQSDPKVVELIAAMPWL